MAAQHVNPDHATDYQRQETEAGILNDIIFLSEFPSVKSSSPNAEPDHSDVTAFKSRVRLFRPSDYDDLIVERNVNDLCGYVLCPRPRKQHGSGGPWKITSNGSIVKREELERWCSPRCARRALYVRVQLNESTPWERVDKPDNQIELMEEGTHVEDEDEAATKLMALNLEDSTKNSERFAEPELERERLSRQTGPRPRDLLLVEKKTQSNPAAATLDVESRGSHLTVEGYKSKR